MIVKEILAKYGMNLQKEQLMMELIIFRLVVMILCMIKEKNGLESLSSY